MFIDRWGLSVKVIGQGQCSKGGNAVSWTSMESSLFSSLVTSD